MDTNKTLKNGCMGCLLVIGGLIVLFVLFFIVSTYYMMSNDDEEISKQQQTFEIVTKQGTVTLHLGMPKDSVIKLVGKPYYMESHSNYDGGITTEFGYNIKDEDITDLHFVFENGRLTEFNQE